MNDNGTGAALGDLNRYNIMVVDDVPENLRLLSRILEARGVRVRAALSGPIALEAIKHQIPDLIILDIRMPEMDGFEVCRRIKADPDLRGIPIIFISVQHELADKVKAFSLGGVDYLNNPFEAEEVIARVKTHLTINTLKRRLQNTNEILEEKVKARTASLQKSEQKYQDLYDNAPDMLLSVDVKNFTILECNQTLATVTGYTKAEIIGQPISFLYTTESWEYSKSTLLPLFMQTGRIEGKELQLRTKNGTVMDVLVNASAVRDDQGEILWSRSSWRDITERKKAEKEIRYARTLITNIIDSMPSILIGVDIEGRVTQWNLAAQLATNLSKKEALGQPLAIAFPRLGIQMDRVADALKTGNVGSYIKQPRDENGTIRYEDVTIYPLLDGIQGAVIRIDDATRRVQMEEMMIQSEKMLSVGGLAAGMAHEINNPIAGLVQTANVMANRLGKKMDIPANRMAAREAGTSLEAIQKFMEARDIIQMLSTIQKSGCRVAALVENMLSFARKSDSLVSSHSLPRLLDKALELAATEYYSGKQYYFKKIEIRKEYKDEECLVPCEGAKIQQVLLNILRNGGQAMLDAKTNNPLFILRIRLEKERNMVCMEIEDNGPGMDEESRRRAFEPFFTTKPVGTGTGLGLSMSYFIITENHGGELLLESRPGFGTKFIICLPLSGYKIKI